MAISLVTVGAKITAALQNLIITAINRQGLTSVVPTSVAGTGVTVGANGVVRVTAGGATASVNGCFTSDFDNYLVSIRAALSTNANLNMRLRLAGADASVASTYTYQQFSVVGGTVFGAANIDNFGAVGPVTSLEHRLNLTFRNPADNEPTWWHADGGATNVANHAFTSADGRHTPSTAYDGFTILPSAGVISSGVIRIYGYNDN